MDRREALKKIAMGGAVVAGHSMISTSPAFAATPSPGPNPNLGPVTTSGVGTFFIHAGFVTNIAPTCNGSPGATWVPRLCWTINDNGTNLPTQCVTEVQNSPTVASGNKNQPTGGFTTGDTILMELTVKVTCPGETPVCFRYTETATATRTGTTITWVYSNYTGPTIVDCPF